MLFSQAALTAHRASLLRRGSRHGVYALQVAATRRSSCAQQRTCTTSVALALHQSAGANLLPQARVSGFVPGAAQRSISWKFHDSTARHFSAMRQQHGGSSPDSVATGTVAPPLQDGAEGERKKGDASEPLTAAPPLKSKPGHKAAPAKAPFPVDGAEGALTRGLTTVRDGIRRAPRAAMELTSKMIKATSRGVVLIFTDPQAVRETLARWKVKFKAELKHYWLGLKLLVADVRTAKKLVRRLLAGHSLTRRENKQLIRTGADIIRIVPMAIFILVPALELLLPVALKLFPNMLPSTFEDKLKAEEQMKQQLKLRMAIATYLQDTMRHMATNMGGTEEGGKEDGEDGKGVTPSQLLAFMARARRGETVSTEEILRFAPLFQDDITLDNVARPQLMAMCSILGLRAYGADAFLRFQLRHRLRSIRVDDKDILWEGLYTLDTRELRAACAERGMRATGLSESQYRKQMQQWLDLSLNKNIPLTLLLMSRSFTFTAPEMETEVKNEITADTDEKHKHDAVQDAQMDSVAVIASSMASVEDELLTEVLVENTQALQKPAPKANMLESNAAATAAAAGDKEAAKKVREAEAKEKADAEALLLAEKVALREKKLESIEYQNELIEDEAIEFEEEKKRQEELDALEHAKVLPAADGQSVVVQAAETRHREPQKEEEQELKGHPQEEIVEPEMWKIDEERLKDAGLEGELYALSDDRLAEDTQHTTADAVVVAGVQIGEIEALEALTQKSAVEPERIKLEHLKLAKEQLDVAALLAAGRIGHESQDSDKPGTFRKSKSPTGRLSKLLESMLHKIEKDIDRLDEQVGDRLHVLDLDGDGQISIHELDTAVREVLRTRVTEEEIRFLISELDEDGDGRVSVEQLSQLLHRYRELAGVPDLDKL